jgi:hypothetical protein
MLTRTGPPYLQLARECIDMAERATPEHREKMLLIAELWLSIAADGPAEPTDDRSDDIRVRSR